MNRERRANATDRRSNDAVLTDHKIERENANHNWGFVINEQRKCIYKHGNKLKLSPKEFVLLCFLLANQGRVVCPKEIIDKLWPMSNRASEEDAKQYIYLLRKKIEEDSSQPEWLHTVKGFGYIFEA